MATMLNLDVDALEGVVARLRGALRGLDERVAQHTSLSVGAEEAWPDVVGRRHARELTGRLGDVEQERHALEVSTTRLSRAAERARLVLEQGSKTIEQIAQGELVAFDGSDVVIAATSTVPVLSGRNAQPGVHELVEAYRTGDDRTKHQCAEALGEVAGLVLLAERVGRPVAARRLGGGAGTVSADDVRCTPGVAWEKALTWHGAGVVNLLFWDGATLVVVECKGGSSRLGERRGVGSDGALTGKMVKQGTWRYLSTIAHCMQDSSLEDGRNEAGDVLEEQLKAKNVEYHSARFGYAKRLRTSGDLSTVIKHEQFDLWKDGR